MSWSTTGTRRDSMVQRDYTDCKDTAASGAEVAREVEAPEAAVREVAARGEEEQEEEAMVEVEEVASAEREKSPVPAPISLDGPGL